MVTSEQQLAERIGRRIVALRLHLGITSEELAKRAGVTKGYISLVENGLRVPSLTVLQRIAEALGHDISAVFN